MTPHLDFTQLPEWMVAAKAIIADTAAWILHERSTFSPEKIEHKAFNDLVSYVDRESEQRLKAAFEKLIPGSGFIGEEGGSYDAQADWRWIVDPLDGTTNFMHNVPAYCISVGLQYKGETLLGIVHDVPRGEVFEAQKGKGAFCNGQKISVSATPDLSGALLGTGFPHVKKESMGDYLAVIQAFLASSQGIRRFGAAALDMAFVACGRLDGFFEMGLKPWDVAAGALLVHEAGGIVTDFQGGAEYLFGRQIVTSNGALQQAMLEVIEKHFGLHKA
jgi:myo-inositol-1(or 4)-monophosphatase